MCNFISSSYRTVTTCSCNQQRTHTHHSHTHHTHTHTHTDGRCLHGACELRPTRARLSTKRGSAANHVLQEALLCLVLLVLFFIISSFFFSFFSFFFFSLLTGNLILPVEWVAQEARLFLVPYLRSRCLLSSSCCCCSSC